MTPAAGERANPILQLRRRRQERRDAQVGLEGETEQFELSHGYRTPILVCPRGCGFYEQARRDLIVRTGFWGRADVTATVKFETSHCPRDGAKLIGSCARCERTVFAPVVDHCEFCGVPQPWAAERRAGAERASLRRWRRSPEEREKEINRVHDPAICVYSTSPDGPDDESTDVWVLDGDVARLEVDAVISNDDIDGQMWSQSARAIKNAAGEGVERMAQEGKPFRLGHAWLTDAGDLKEMKGIIHVASMSRYGKSSIETVRKCLSAAFELAAKREFRSIGLTAFGTGPAAINRDEWIEVFAETAVGFIGGPAGSGGSRKIAIVLALFERGEIEEQVDRVRGAFRRAWVKHGEPADGRPWPSWPINL